MKNSKGESGQALVEFALVLPILVLLVFGVIEFSRVYLSYQVVTSAAREGARSAALGDNDTQIQTKIAGSVSSIVNVPANVQLQPGPDFPANLDPLDPTETYIYYTVLKDTTHETVTVTVKGAVLLVVPIISEMFPDNTAVLKSQAEMRMEY